MQEEQDTEFKSHQEPYFFVCAPGSLELSNIGPIDGDSKGIGYCSLRGDRDYQEDGLLFANFEAEKTPQQIGNALRTSCLELDKEIIARGIKAGTTAIVTVYQRGAFITATLGDSVAFLAIYNQNQEFVGLFRLNERIHSPNDALERARIINQGGTIDYDEISDCWRVNENLAMSRAIGDRSLKPHVNAEADIDIVTKAEIANKFGIAEEDISAMLLIQTSDGFTDGAQIQSTAVMNQERDKKIQEDYLAFNLQKTFQLGKISETELAQALCKQAWLDDSGDNTSIIIKKITKDTQPFVMNVSDGHGGKEASEYVVQNLRTTFNAMCELGHSSPRYQPNSGANYPWFFDDPKCENSLDSPVSNSYHN